MPARSRRNRKKLKKNNEDFQMSAGQLSDDDNNSFEIKQRGESDDDYSLQEKINKKKAQILGTGKRGGKRRNKMMDDIDKVSLASDVEDDNNSDF